MNQILITEKLYVTPELKRKKKIYKILFMISIFLVISLCSIYIYAEYDRNKDSGVSDEILSSFLSSDDTLVGEEQNALVVQLTHEVAENIEEYQETEEEPIEVAPSTATFTASNGKTYEYIGRVTIPKINVDYAILPQASDIKTIEALMKVSIIKFHGADPNEVGNLCLVGHNYRNSRFFSKVPDLEVGDIVEITDLSKRTIQYEVYDIHTVYPNNRDDTTQYTNGKREVTLITCTDDSEQRVIVKCREKV